MGRGAHLKLRSPRSCSKKTSKSQICDSRGEPLLDVKLLWTPASSRQFVFHHHSGGGSHSTNLLFGGCQVVRSCLKELEDLLALGDVGRQLDQGLWMKQEIQ